MPLRTFADLPFPLPGRHGWPWDSYEFPGQAPVAGGRATGGRAWPRVTVVTPSFNQAPWLEETIRSVLAQDYPNLEYFIFDGGSTDGSIDIMKKYDGLVDYWVSGTDGGQSDAINEGWRRATGTIVAYMNSDDLYCPGAIRRAVEHLEAHPDVGIVYGNFRAINGASEVLHPCVAPQPYSVRGLFLWTALIPQPTTFIRRTVLDLTGLLDVSLYYIMDYDLWGRATLAGVRFAQLDGPALACMRDWPGNHSNAGVDEFFSVARRVLERLFGDARLPAELRGMLDLAYAHVYVQAALDRYWHDESGRTYRYLLEAARVAPSIVASGRFLSVLGKALVPGGLRWRARRLKRWLGGDGHRG